MKQTQQAKLVLFVVVELAVVYFLANLGHDTQYVITTSKQAGESCLTNSKNCEGHFSYIAPFESTRDQPTTLSDADACALTWAETAPNSPFPAFRKHQKRSTYDEDLIIWRLIRHLAEKEAIIPHGTFLEMGAFDGISEANTRFFEECLGWGGILVEGHPSSFRRLGADDRRPLAHKLNFVPACSSMNVTHMGNRDDTGARLSELDSRFGEFVKIHCAPLTLYLQALGIAKINFFSLDVEGSEMKVLSNIDFDLVTFDILMVEVKNSDKVAIATLLETNGYVICKSIHGSDIFVPKGSNMLKACEHI